LHRQVSEVNVKVAFLLVVVSLTSPVRAQSPPPDDALAHQVITVRDETRRNPSASTTVVTASELRAVPKRTAEDALRLVPGLTLAQHGSEGKGHQFFLRGFDAMHGSDLEATLNGIPVNEWSNVHAQGYIDLGFIIPETIYSVEVTKGPFNLGQGAFAMAGSATYRLGVPEMFRGTHVGYTAGSTNRHRAVFVHSAREGNGHDFLAVEGVRDSGFGQNRAIQRGSVMANATLARSDYFGSVSLLGGLYFADFELPGSMRHDDVQSGRRGFYDSYDHDNSGQSGRALLALRQHWRNDTSSLETAMYVGRRRLALQENYTGFLSDPTNGDGRSQRQNTWSLGVNARYTHELTSTFDAKGIIGTRSEHLDQTQRHVGQAAQPLTLDRSLQGWQHLLHAGAGLGFSPSSSIHGELGARLDVAQTTGRDRVDKRDYTSKPLAVLSPRATLEWQTNDALAVLLSYGRGFRPPEARAFTPYVPQVTSLGEELYDGGQPKMTVADALELGARWQHNRYFGGSLSGFGTLVERESIFDHVSGTNLELNATRRLGVELTFRSNPTHWLLLMADVTAVDARFVESGNPIPMAPWLVGGLRALFTHELGVRAGLRFMALAPRALPHGAVGSPLAALDLTAGHTWGPLQFDLEIENLLNMRLREGEYHYGSDWRTTDNRSALPVIHYVAGPPRNLRLSVAASW
jgi:iron complex outermembrane recepter protein